MKLSRAIDYPSSPALIVHEVAEFFQGMMSRSFLIGYKTISDLASRLCSFAVVLLAVRLLSTEQFGFFSLAWAAGWMVSIGSDFGLQLHLTKEVARRPDLAKDIFTRLRRLRLALCGVVFLAVALVAPTLVGAVHWTAFLLVVLSQIFNSLIEFHSHLYRGLSRSDLESSLNLATRLAMIALAAVFLLSFQSFPALALALALSNGLGYAATHLLSKTILSRTAPAFGPAQAPPNRVQVPSTNPIPAAFDKSLLRQILPIGLGIVLSAFYFRIDLFFIERWHGAESVALYNAVFRLIDALRLLPAAVMAVIFPDLCRPGAARILFPALVGLSALSLALASGGYWQATWMIGLCYGPAYLGAAPSFRLLLLSLPFLFVNLLLTHQLIALNLQRAWAILCGMGLLASLLLNTLWVPLQGPVGAAKACLVRELLLTAACGLILYLKRDALDPTVPTEASLP